MVLPRSLGGRVGRCQTQKLDGEIQPVAEVVKLVDTLDSKSSGGDPVPVRFRLSAPALSDQSENSSAGRAQPCQGWGRGFEPRFSLHTFNILCQWLNCTETGFVNPFPTGFPTKNCSFLKASNYLSDSVQNISSVKNESVYSLFCQTRFFSKPRFFSSQVSSRNPLTNQSTHPDSVFISARTASRLFNPIWLKSACFLFW